ncbi:rodlet layer protein [Streptomyces sp. RB6PN25]|uniref:Rodlet layer protein n=1 Tax=Streptomyces humicola TaxID=2953240 RepID=A0ABT1PYT5_9ACTN|nr:rodlet layer protein [Streptomyces humicola]MCQ4082841.1 rodlet layer protein [Streptomyces humicola]
MIKKALATAGVTAAAGSLQGDGGTNITGTWGDRSPNFHFLDNPNICLPQIKDVQVANLVAVQVPAGVGNQATKQICNQGQTTHGTGDGQLSHLIG